MFAEPMNVHDTFRDEQEANSPLFLRRSYTFWHVLKRTNGAQKRKNCRRLVRVFRRDWVLSCVFNGGEFESQKRTQHKFFYHLIVM